MHVFVVVRVAVRDSLGLVREKSIRILLGEIVDIIVTVSMVMSLVAVIVGIIVALSMVVSLVMRVFFFMHM